MLFSLFSLAFVAPLCLGDHLTETYPFTKTLSEGYYYLFWNFSSIDETIQFAVRVKTTGWVGFGISPNGQMPGSDVVIGWIDRQKSYFHVSNCNLWKLSFIVKSKRLTSCCIYIIYIYVFCMHSEGSICSWTL